MKPHLNYIAGMWFCNGSGIGVAAKSVNESLELWKRCVRIANNLSSELPASAALTGESE